MINSIAGCEFEAKIIAPGADREALANALSLYRGDFLADFNLPDSLSFENWVIVERERYRRLAVRDFTHLARLHEAEKDYRAALEALDRVMIMNVRGHFEKFTGEVHFDEQNPALSTVEVQIEAASINSNEPKRDAHLKSPDFLNVENYPYILFRSKRVEVEDDRRGRIIGDLTIRDVTQEVVLETEYPGQSQSPWGMTSAGFSAHTRINRKDWGLTWNVALETGDVLVRDEISINIELGIIKEAEAEPELEAEMA